MSDEQNMNIEKNEHLFQLMTIAAWEKANADAYTLRVLDEVLWETKDNLEQYARIEETRRCLEILNTMSRNVLEEELNHQSYLLEILRERAERIQRRGDCDKTETVLS